MSSVLKVISLQTGSAKPLLIDGRQVMSAIDKQARTGAVAVTALGLAGDEQVELSVHGGLSKAIYAYPSEHYAYWQGEGAASLFPTPLSFGHLGENLTLAGLLETEVFIGDELHFPDCVLRVTEPREPCFKFNAVMGDKLAAKKMAQTGFCGFYLSVLQTGSISADQTFTLRAGPREMSVLMRFKTAMFKTRND